jgi:hypothetical protein
VKMSPDIAVDKRVMLSSAKFKLLQTLKEGEWFGERSLYIDGEVYLLSYQSRSFCEILYLSATSFKRQCQLHLTKLERDSLDKYLQQRADYHSRGSVLQKEKSEDGESSDEEPKADDNAKCSEAEDGGAMIGGGGGGMARASNIHHANPSSGLELNQLPASRLGQEQGAGHLKVEQEIGRNVRFSPPSESDSESTYDGPTGPVIISRKQRRVALQIGVSLKLEESNYITVWFHPESRIMMLWRVVVAFAVLYYMFSAPLLLSISFDDNIFSQHLTLLVVCYLSDLTMIVNLVMAMFYFPFIKDGIVVSKSSEIFLFYRSNHLIFLDILALLPYDLFAIYLGPNFIPLLRLPRLYLVLQTTRYLNELKGFSETMITGQLLVLVWWLYMLIHWFGCLFILSARISTRLFHYETNWIEADQASEIYYFDHTDFNNLALYFRAIYWALYVCSSAGYFDILPTNPIETVTATLIMLYGCQMVLGCLGSVSSVVGTFTSDKISYQTKLENTQALAERKGLSLPIREKLACYFQYNWERCRGVDEAQVLLNLPLPLRQGVIKEITGAVLRKIAFFKDCSDGILNAILASLHPRIFIDGDSVVTAGPRPSSFLCSSLIFP